MLAATFKITQVFVLTLLNRIVAVGNVMSGDIFNGMWMVTGENNACFKIYSVEGIRSKEDRALIGLTFNCKDEYELKFKLELLKKMEGETMLITDKMDVS